MVLSLAGNFTLFAWVSVLSRTRVSEHWQAGRFIGQEISARPNARSMLSVQIDDLLQLAARFVGEERARQSFFVDYRQGKAFNPNQNAAAKDRPTESLLAGGLALLDASGGNTASKSEMQLEDVVRIADKTRSPPFPARCCKAH